MFCMELCREHLGAALKAICVPHLVQCHRNIGAVEIYRDILLVLAKIGLTQCAHSDRQLSKSVAPTLGNRLPLDLIYEVRAAI